MRLLLAAASCILIGACSSTAVQSSPAGTTPRAAPSSPMRSVTASAASVDPCGLLSTAELESLAGGRVGAANTGRIGALATCQWATSSGGFVQVGASTSPEWARSLPEAVRVLTEAGLASDPENLEKLRRAATLVSSGRDLDPTEACSLFSAMVELQGQPAGMNSIVTLVPTRENPKAVTGQMCDGGRFTSVMLADESGLDGSPPIQKVSDLLKTAHLRTLG